MWPRVLYKIKTLPTMNRSRPIIKVVSHKGIKFGRSKFGMDRPIRTAVMSSLSPAGSSKAPSFDFCRRMRAAIPSSRSVKAAAVKTIRAAVDFPEISSHKKKGMIIIRDKLIQFGMVNSEFVLSLVSCIYIYVIFRDIIIDSDRSSLL